MDLNPVQERALGWVQLSGGGGAISPNCRADHMSECTPVNDTKLLVSEAIQREHICSARENAQV